MSEPGDLPLIRNDRCFRVKGMRKLNLVFISSALLRYWSNGIVMLRSAAIVLCLLAYPSLAQELDTLCLEDISIYGAPLSKYASGSKVVAVGKVSGTLNESIAEQLPVYFKNYGNGQLSTVAFRGTSASHTAVLWNGILVNSPTLGQTDFSLWPSFLLDTVALQFGSSGSLYGSGAIGGTVFLESRKPDISDDFELTLLSQSGSFGRFMNGLSASFKQGKLTGKSRVFHHSLANDFEYPLKGTERTQRQNNAAVTQYGITQDLYLALKNQELGFHSQFTRNDREIQPSVASNDADDELEDYNLRLAIDHILYLKSAQWNNTVAFILNDQYFNSDSRVVSQQFSGVTNYNVPLGKLGDLRVGGNVNYFTAQTQSYYATDWQTDIYASVSIQPFSNWRLGLNLRQVFNTTAQPVCSKLRLRVFNPDFNRFQTYR